MSVCLELSSIVDRKSTTETDCGAVRVKMRSSGYSFCQDSAKVIKIYVNITHHPLHFLSCMVPLYNEV